MQLLDHENSKLPQAAVEVADKQGWPNIPGAAVFRQLQHLPGTQLKPVMEFVPLVRTHQPTSKCGHADLLPGTTALSHVPSSSGRQTLAWT